MSEKGKTTQSVILNLNKNYANSKAHDFLQPVAQQLDIGKNAEVCLYGATINRQPLFINKDKNNNTFNFQIAPQVFPDKRQQENSSVVLDIDKLPNSLLGEFAVGYEILSGGFSIQEFGQTMVNNINYTTTELVNGNNVENKDGDQVTCGGLDLVKQFPYSYIYNNDEDFYLGFQGVPIQKKGYGDQLEIFGKYNNSQFFRTDNNETYNTSGSLKLELNEEQNNGINGIRKITANASINTTGYQAFSQIHSSPIFPLFRQQKQLNSTLNSGENESYFEFNIMTDDTNNTKTTDFIVGFTNTFLQSGWTTTSIPETTTLFPDAIDIPQTFLGVKVKEDINTGDIVESYAEVYLCNKITQYTEYIDDQTILGQLFQDGCSRICRVDISERLSEACKMGFRFYAVDNQYNFYQGQKQQLPGFAGTINPNATSMYPRVYGFQFYFRPSAGEIQIVYDSKNDNIFIPQYYLEDGFCFNSARSQRTAGEYCNLGFQPYFFVNKLESGEGLSSPRGNYIAHMDILDDVIIYRYGMEFYEYISKNKDFLNVLGIPQDKTITQKLINAGEEWNFLKTKRYDGNAYPEFKQMAGINKLYNDNNSYNIELNLPIKAYNTTELTVGNGAKRVPGQKRTIVYKTDSFLEGEVQGINQYYLNKNVTPNNLKFLTLNNDKPLNINELNVQIRRSTTNELATELEDCSVELLITSEN
jgi:hypothetical protein